VCSPDIELAPTSGSPWATETNPDLRSHPGDRFGVSWRGRVALEGGTYLLRVTTAGTKNVIFSNTVDIGTNADWLIVTTPSGGTGFLTPNDIKVLVTKANDAGKTMQEFGNAP